MRILLADNNIIFREGVALLIERLFDRVVLEKRSNWAEVNQYLQGNSPNLILINRELPGSLSWRYDLKHITSTKPNASVCLLFNSLDTIDPQSAYQLGIKGYINEATSIPEFQSSIANIGNGKPWFKSHHNAALPDAAAAIPKPHLTHRQLQILAFIKEGSSNKSISARLALTEGTVKQHLNKVYKTLHARNRVEAISVATQMGFI